MGLLTLMGLAVLLAQGLPAVPVPAPDLRTTYRCGDDLVVPVWTSGSSVDLFLDGQLERLVAPRPSQPRYVNERREWRVTRTGARLSVPGQSDLLSQPCVVEGHRSRVPFVDPLLVTCDDARSVVVRPVLEGLVLEFQGERLGLREVPDAGGMFYTDGRQRWRGRPGAFSLSNADGTRVRARGCRWAPEATVATLTGTLTVRGGRTLPVGAVVDVRLVEASRADAPSIALARQVLVIGAGAASMSFTLEYAPAATPAGGHYLLQATASVEGRIRWRTTTAVVVLDGAAGTPPVLVLEPMR